MGFISQYPNIHYKIHRHVFAPFSESQLWPIPFLIRIDKSSAKVVRCLVHIEHNGRKQNNIRCPEIEITSREVRRLQYCFSIWHPFDGTSFRSLEGSFFFASTGGLDPLVYISQWTEDIVAQCRRCWDWHWTLNNLMFTI